MKHFRLLAAGGHGLSLLLATTFANNSTVPVTDAGPDQTIYLGQSVTLNGSATNHSIGWLWEVISAPSSSNWTLADATISNALFTIDTLGDYIITLEAQNYFAVFARWLCFEEHWLGT